MSDDARDEVRELIAAIAALAREVRDLREEIGRLRGEFAQLGANAAPVPPPHPLADVLGLARDVLNPGKKGKRR